VYPPTLGRELRRTATSARYLLVALVIPLGLYLLYPLTGLAADEVGRQIEGSSWSGYFLVAMATLGAVAAATAIGAGRVVAAPAGTRTAPPAPPTLAEAAGRVVTAALLALPPLVVMGITAASVDGVTLPIAHWLELGGELMLGAVPFAALGLLLAVVVVPDVLDIVLLAVVVVLAILGGLFQPPSTFPADVTAVAHVLPSFRLADLGWAAIAGGRPSLPDAAVLLSYTVAIGALFAWRWRAGSGRSDA
jgi:ABC-2 type transport system permease protein